MAKEIKPTDLQNLISYLLIKKKVAMRKITGKNTEEEEKAVSAILDENPGFPKYTSMLKQLIEDCENMEALQQGMSKPKNNQDECK